MNNANEQVQNILTSYGLDFSIEKLPLAAPRITGDGIEYVETPYYGLYNDKTKEVINTVKEGYAVSQNKDLVELVLEGMKGFGELSVHKAGSLNGGKKVYIQLAIEGVSKVGNDIIKRYVTILDSNDSSSGLSIGIGDLTMSCSNQFFQFYKSGEAKFRHSSSLVQKMATIPNLIKLALSQSLNMIETYNTFQSTPCSRNAANDMVKHIIGFDRTTDKVELSEKSTQSINKMNALYNAIDIEMNQKGNNVWGLHSGVTRWTTHDNSAPKRENGRIESSLVSGNYNINQKSLKFAKVMSGMLSKV